MGTTSSSPKSRRVAKSSSTHPRKQSEAARTLRLLISQRLRLDAAVERLMIKQETMTKERASLLRREHTEHAQRKKIGEKLKFQLGILRTREQERFDQAVARFRKIEHKLDEVPYLVTIRFGTVTVTQPGGWRKPPVIYKEARIGTERHYFSKIIRHPRWTPQDQQRFKKSRSLYSDATKIFAKAKARHKLVSLLIALGPEDVSGNSCLPTTLLNLIGTRDSLDKSTTRTKLNALERSFDAIGHQISQKQTVIAGIKSEIRRLETVFAKNQDSQAAPPSRQLMQWTDAEALAHEYCKWLGYERANLTGEGSDGGVDIEGLHIVAQVKMHNRPTGRPELQQLYGVAASLRKRALFFAMAYSADAGDWADKVGVRLYQFQRDGTVQPIGFASKNDAIYGINFENQAALRSRRSQDTKSI